MPGTIPSAGVIRMEKIQAHGSKESQTDCGVQT